MFRYLTLSATLVYLTGVLVGYFMDPPFGDGWPDITRPLPYLEQSKEVLLWSIAGRPCSRVITSPAAWPFAKLLHRSNS